MGEFHSRFSRGTLENTQRREDSPKYPEPQRKYYFLYYREGAIFLEIFQDPFRVPEWSNDFIADFVVKKLDKF